MEDRSAAAAFDATALVVRQFTPVSSGASVTDSGF